MRWTTAVRWTGCVRFLPVLFAVTCLMAVRDTAPTGYAAADLASASFALAFGGSLTAAWAALQFRGFPRFVRQLRSARAGFTVVVRAWGPLLLGAPLVVCLAVVVAAGTFADDAASWSVLAVAYLTVLACGLVGAAFTWALPVVVAVPSVTVLWFVWLAYTPATGSALLHTMSSTFTGCCSASTRPATVAVLASLTFVVALCVGVVVMLLPRRWSSRSRLVIAPAVAAVLGLGFVAGAGVARSADRPLSLVPVEPRTTALVCQTVAGVQVCTWPENSSRAAEIAAIAGRLNPVLEDWGMQPVTTIAQGNRIPGAVDVEASEHLDAGSLRVSLAAGYVDRLAGCTGATGRARDERVVAVAVAAGLDRVSLNGSFDPASVAAAVQAVERGWTSPSSLKAWFLDGTRAIRCWSDR